VRVYKKKGGRALSIPLKFTQLAKDVTKSSAGFFKTATLSLRLASEENKLREIYVDIGKKVSEIYHCGGSLGGGFDSIFSTAREAEERVNNVKNQLDAAKGTKTCSKCGKTMDRAATFCPKCGQKAPGAPNTQPAATAETVIEAKRICAACGAENAPANSFCNSCGRNL
jgi:ribosomal protein L40E